MANTTTTPNMGLPNPVPGVDPGPDYASNIQSSFNILDQHNHSPPNGGVQINPSGLNINSNLPFNGNQATSVGAVLFSNQPSLSTLNTLYTINGDLWFNDPTNPVQITSGGAVNATASGISDGSGNSAAFSTGVLVVQNSSTAPNSVQCGSILLGNTGTPSSGFVTVSPPPSTSSYSLTLPTIPPATSFAQIDTSGNISASIPVSNGITRPNLAAVGQQMSAPVSTIALSNGTLNYVTGLTVTITTSGRPVIVFMQSGPSSNGSGSLFMQNTGSGANFINIAITRDAGVTFPYEVSLGIGVPSPVVGFSHGASPGVIFFMDTPTAGTYTYQIYAAQAGATQYELSNCVLVAYEL